MRYLQLVRRDAQKELCPRGNKSEGRETNCLIHLKQKYSISELARKRSNVSEYKIKEK